MNLTLAAAFLGAGVAGASAQSLKGESGLVGIKLYDTGTRVISVYGSPDDIQAVTFGGGAVGPAGGAGTGGRGAGPGGLPAAQGGAGGAADTNFDFSFGNDVLRQGAAGGIDFGVGPPPGQGGGPSGAPPGLGGDGRGGGAPGLAGGGGGGGAAASSGRVVFTRWVYKRGGSRYAFVMDKANKVIQIEAIGLSNSRVRTSTGITFGASFGTIIKTYGPPDGYELLGDHLMVRYLVRNKVAFRLSRLGQDKPHVVTGIVVAAGKD